MIETLKEISFFLINIFRLTKLVQLGYGLRTE